MNNETERDVDFRLVNFQSLSPKHGVGRFATFDVSFGGYVTVVGLAFHMAEDGFYKIITPRIAKADVFTVEMPKWLCRNIARRAADALRAIGHSIPDRSPRGSFPVADPEDRTRHERPDAGLKRVLSAEVEECERACL